MRKEHEALRGFKQASDPYNGDELRIKEFNELRNKAQYIINKAKHTFFKTKLEENSNNSKGLWNTLTKLEGLPTKKFKVLIFNNRVAY